MVRSGKDKNLTKEKNGKEWKNNEYRLNTVMDEKSIEDSSSTPVKSTTMKILKSMTKSEIMKYEISFNS